MHEAIALDGMFLEEGAKTALRIIARFEPTVVADKIALARTFTNEFARRAKAKFSA